jgi:hypothetical protein
MIQIFSLALIDTISSIFDTINNVTFLIGGGVVMFKNHSVVQIVLSILI